MGGAGEGGVQMSMPVLSESERVEGSSGELLSESGSSSLSSSSS